MMIANIYIKNSNLDSFIEVPSLEKITVTSGCNTLEAILDTENLSQLSIRESFTYNFFGEGNLSIPGSEIYYVTFDN